MGAIITTVVVSAAGLAVTGAYCMTNYDWREATNSNNGQTSLAVRGVRVAGAATFTGLQFALEAGRRVGAYAADKVSVACDTCSVVAFGAKHAALRWRNPQPVQAQQTQQPQSSNSSEGTELRRRVRSIIPPPGVVDSAPLPLPVCPE